MCYFITATLPKKADIQKLEPLLSSCKLAVSPIENQSMQEIIGPERFYFQPTQTECDCGTPLGGLNTRQPYKPEVLQKQAEAYRRKGWSQNKIDRWLKSKQSVKERNEKIEYARQQDWLVDASGWRTAIQKILDSGMVSEFGLLLRWYTDSVSDQMTDVTIRNVEIKNTDIEYFNQYPENTLTYFT